MQQIKELSMVFAMIVIACLVALFAFTLIETSLNRSEVVSCLKLQKQSKQFAEFTLAPWEEEMCATHSITINSPVK